MKNWLKKRHKTDEFKIETIHSSTILPKILVDGEVENGFSETGGVKKKGFPAPFLSYLIVLFIL